MSMRSLALTVSLMLGFVSGTRAEPQDAFLDGPMPRGIFPLWQPTVGQDPKLRDEVDQFPTFQDRLVALKRWMPRPVVLPDGLYDFIGKIDAQDEPFDSLRSRFQDERNGWSNGPRVTYRDFLFDTCLLLGLNWHYDAKRDALVTSFAWRREDPRSPRELVQYLEATQPLPSNELGMPIGKNGIIDYKDNDPWRKALDALISHPENFPRTWKLRFLDDTRGGDGPMPGKILWSGQMSEQDGPTRFVVIKYHATFTMPGPTASFDCYIFDLDGRFLDGAILSDRYEAISPPRLSLSASGKTLQATRGPWSLTASGKTLRAGPAAHIGSFSLSYDRIVFSPTSTYQGDYLGREIYCAPQAEGLPVH